MSYRRRNQRKKSNFKKVLIIVSLATVGIFAFSTLAFAVVAYKITSELPDLEEAATKTQLAQTTKVFAANGKLIAKLHSEENREVVPLEKISPYLRKAVIAIEDERFYQHQGIDPEAILRALVVDISYGQIREGGSTITQQYVKNMFTTREKTIQRKIKEAILAYQIENIYSKNKILEKYLNTIYYGHGCYGAETAAWVYFGKHASELTLSEAALLAGVIRAPLKYSPHFNPKLAKERRDLVLTKMRSLGYISEKEEEAAKKTPIKVLPLKSPSTFAPYFVEYVKQLLIKKYGANQVFKGGLRIYTTLDPRLQTYAEEAVKNTLDRPNDPSASLVAIETSTGRIKAMVGGKNFNKEKFNLAVQGLRQPGSSFKPFVLATGIENGFSPSKVYPSSPTVIKLPGKDWYVRNATEGRGGGQMTLRQATIHSVNAVYARFMMDVGPKKVVEIAKKMGITAPLDPYPAITLGGLRYGVSALEMASAYSTLARGGDYIQPTAILKITTSDGKIIENNKPIRKPAISALTAYLVTDILKDAILYGTGRRANFGFPAAGKTGTTQNYHDAWFVGYTPYYSCAVWIGYRNRQMSLRNIHGFGRVAGGTLPAIIWRRFMEKAHRGLAYKDFPRPKKGVVEVKICVESGLRATEYCPKTTWGIFIRGKSPVKFCDIHKGIPVPNVIGKKSRQATSILQSAGFKVNPVLEYHPAVAAGLVFSQSPAAGTKAKAESIITIYVSKGKPPAPPPPPPSPPSEETTP